MHVETSQTLLMVVPPLTGGETEVSGQLSNLSYQWWNQNLNWTYSFPIKCYFQQNTQVSGMHRCGGSEDYRNAENKGTIHSFSKHLVMNKVWCLVLGHKEE